MRSGEVSLQLPESLKREILRIAEEDGVTLNQFLVMAAAEKLSALRTADYFAEHRSKADMDLFDRILNRRGGEPPVEDDRID
ncbi:MAG: hypothetical protein RLY86_916 [Pseudomonadota bacterium]|jgi:hypothetical protein